MLCGALQWRRVSLSFKFNTIFDELQPMIQQSQFSLMQMLFPEHPPILNQDLIEEEQKICQSPLPTQQETVEPDFNKKLSKKSVCETPKSRRGSRGQESINPNQRYGHWAIDENKRYHWFLEIHNHHFLNKHMRRMDKIFKTMAVFVGTREAEQCRSHHQKMEKKYHTIGKILLNLRKHHYESENQQNLIEDLNNNQIDIVDQILTAQYLHSISNDQSVPENMERKESNVQIEGVLNDLMFEEEEKKICGGQIDEEGLKILPLNENGMDIVDELFGDVAPHVNFQMM